MLVVLCKDARWAKEGSNYKSFVERKGTEVEFKRLENKVNTYEERPSGSGSLVTRVAVSSPPPFTSL